MVVDHAFLLPWSFVSHPRACALVSCCSRRFVLFTKSDGAAVPECVPSISAAQLCRCRFAMPASASRLSWGRRSKIVAEGRDTNGACRRE